MKTVTPLATRTIATAATVFRVKAVAITSDGKARAVVHARFAVYAALRAAGLSLHDIATACGRSDHTTVRSGLDRCALLRRDATYAARYQRVEAAAVGDAPVRDVVRPLAPSLAWCAQWQAERTRMRTQTRGKDSTRVETKIKTLNLAMRELVAALKELDQ